MSCVNRTAKPSERRHCTCFRCYVRYHQDELEENLSNTLYVVVIIVFLWLEKKLFPN
jgi:uncharacterized paraquat-inducible protein A